MPPIEIPLLADHHSHPLLYATLQQAVDLSDVTELDDACDLIQQSADPQAGLTVAHGWKDNRFEIPESRLQQLPPVAIFNVSLHQLLINASGQSLLSAQYGEVINRVNDRRWYESHLPTVLNWFANLAGSAEILVQFYEQLEGLGVWSAEEMLLVDEREIDWFSQAGLLQRTKFWAAPDTFSNLSVSGRQQVHGLKLFTDGAIGARSAAIQQAYQAGGQTEKNHGMLIHTDHQLQCQLAQAAESHKAIAIHAIGDRAIEQAITQLEGIGPLIDHFPEIRLEHVQLINLAQACRAKRQGIVLSMQPNFSSDSVNYSDRLPDGYAEQNNPFRMLIDKAGFEPGVDLILGSDGMPHGAAFALQQSLYPPVENQRLSLPEFVAGYGSNSDKLFRVDIESPG